MSVLLSLISKLLSLLLVGAIIVTALALLLSQTLLSSRYIEGELSATNSYSRLSDALVNEFVTQSQKDGQQVDPTLKDKLKTVLTPVVLQQKLDLALENLQLYYQGKGNAPVINVSDLVTKARAVGIQIGDNSGLDKPITIAGGNNKIKGAGKQFDHAKLLGVAVSAVLAVLLALVSWRRRKWVAIPDVLIWIGISLGIVAAVFTFGPGVAEHYLKFNAASNAFASLGHDLAVAIVHDLGRRLGIVAASYLVAGIAIRIILHKYHPVQKPAFLKEK